MRGNSHLFHLPHLFLSGIITELPKKLKERGEGLSGGQKQSINLARSILHDPALLILDEPCAGLDVPTRETFLQSLEKLVRKRTQLIYVTHRIEEIMPCFTHILYLKNEN